MFLSISYSMYGMKVYKKDLGRGAETQRQMTAPFLVRTTVETESPNKLLFLISSVTFDPTCAHTRYH